MLETPTVVIDPKLCIGVGLYTFSLAIFSSSRTTLGYTSIFEVDGSVSYRVLIF